MRTSNDSMTCNILFLLLYIPGVVLSHLISCFYLVDLVDVVRCSPRRSSL